MIMVNFIRLICTAVPVLSVFIGCCCNVIFLEYLVKEDPGSGNLITFSQFLFIAVYGFIFTAKCGFQKPKIALKNYLILVGMFYVTNVFNNYAFDLNIPMPLHMIFRAGSLIANMIMGIIILKKEYTFDKYLSVGMITFGIFLCTIVSGQHVEKSKGQSVKNNVETTELEDFFWWAVGIACLTLALFISARMGIYQEVLYKKHGKHPDEAVFYTHLIPLPLFILLAPNLYDHFDIAMKSESMILPILNVTFPCIFVYLVGNVLTQYICISSVYRLTTQYSSLAVTLVITLRKFVSLIFSILYFENPFTIYHWIGTILVFLGTIIFTEVIPKLQVSMQTQIKEKSAKKKK